MINLKSYSFSYSFLLSISLIISIISNACTASYRLSPLINNSNNQEKFLFEGQEIAFQKQDSLAVLIFGYKEVNEPLSLYIAYYNFSSTPIDIYPENIVANAQINRVNQAGRKFNGLEKLKVYSSEEYLRKIKASQQASQLTSVLAGIAAAYQSGYTKQRTTGTIGGEAVRLETESFDQSKVNQNLTENRKMLEEKQKQYDLQTLTIEQLILKRNTLWPNSYLDGFVFVKHKDFSKIDLKIPFGPIIFEFNFIPK